VKPLSKTARLPRNSLHFRRQILHLGYYTDDPEYDMHHTCVTCVTRVLHEVEGAARAEASANDGPKLCTGLGHRYPEIACPKNLDFVLWSIPFS
jgi:hypothetical protein